MPEKEKKKLIENYNEILENLNSLNTTLGWINPRLWHIKPRKTEKIFKVNDFIELRLEDGRTTIYIAGKSFAYCHTNFFIIALSLLLE